MANDESAERRKLSPVVEACLVSAVLVVVLWLFEVANGDVANFGSLLVLDGKPRTMLILIVLTGFIRGASRHADETFQRDIAGGTSTSISSTHSQKMAVNAAMLGGALFGAMIARDARAVPLLFSAEPLDHHNVAALSLNIILFGLMGRTSFRSFNSNSSSGALASVMPKVDLFDLEPFKPFARHGLRGAMLWLGGSSIASLLFVNQGHGLVTGLVIAATVGLGTYSLLSPLRGVHTVILKAKQEELANVRSQLRDLRTHMLEPSTSKSLDASQRIPGLLAYEQRISAVREWPMDVPTIVRFALLVTVAVGSWLGGAVVEVLLGTVIDG